MPEEPGREQADATERWSNRRIIFLAVVVALVFYTVFHLLPTLGYLLVQARSIVILLILSIALSYFVLPLVTQLCRVRVDLAPRLKRSIAALLAILVSLALFVLLAAVVAAPIIEESVQVVQATTRWAQDDLPEKLDRFTQRVLERLPPQYREEIEEQIAAAEEKWTLQRIASIVGERIEEWASAILEWHLGVITTILSSGRHLIALVLIPVLAYYFLTDATAIRRGIGAQLRPGLRARFNRMIDEIDGVIQGYVQTIMVISLIIGLATIATLYFAGVDAYLTFGILAGVANMVPVLGAVVAVILITAITLMQVGLQRTIIVLVIYGAIELIVDRIVSPKLMANRAHLNPIAVILALLVGAEFFGIIGIFIAVPVLAAARVAWIHCRTCVAEGDHVRPFATLEEARQHAVEEAGAAADQDEGPHEDGSVEPDEQQDDSAPIDGDEAET